MDVRHRNIRNCRESGARGMRLTAAKDRTFKTVRPNQETLTDASNASSRTPTTKSRLCRLTIVHCAPAHRLSGTVVGAPAPFEDR